MVKIIQGYTGFLFFYLFFTYLHHRRGDGRGGGGILTTFTGVFIHHRILHIDCSLGDFAESGVAGDPLFNIACPLECLCVSAGALEIGRVGAGNVSDVVLRHFVSCLLVLFIILFKIIQFYKMDQFLRGVQFYQSLSCG